MTRGIAKDDEATPPTGETRLRKKAEVAAFLGVTAGYVGRISSRELAVVRVGRVSRYPPEDIQAFIDHRRTFQPGPKTHGLYREFPCLVVPASPPPLATSAKPAPVTPKFVRLSSLPTEFSVAASEAIRGIRGEGIPLTETVFRS